MRRSLNRLPIIALAFAILLTGAGLASADVAPGPMPPPRPAPPPQPVTTVLQRHFVVTGVDKHEGVTFMLVLYRGGEFKAAKQISNDVPFEGFTRAQERHGEGTPSWKLHAIFTTELPEAITGEWLDKAEKLSLTLHHQFKSYRFSNEQGVTRERISYKVDIVKEEDSRFLTLTRTKLELFDSSGKVVRTEEGADSDEDGVIDGDESMPIATPGHPVPTWALISAAIIGLLAVISIGVLRRRG